MQPAGGGGKAVRATKFTLEDENGKTRAELDMGTFGARLSFLDEHGQPRAALIAYQYGGKLLLYDEKGKPRVMLGMNPEGPVLLLWDENVRARATLGAWRTTTPDGKVTTYPESTLRLFDPDGTLRWQSP